MAQHFPAGSRRAQPGRRCGLSLERTVTDLYGHESPIGEALLTHLSHVDWHLGMIAALRGMLGERGTATI